MAAGPNFVLDKGYLAQGTAAYALGQGVKYGTAEQSVTPVTAANDILAGICQENIDATRVTTGKAVINVRKMGISLVLSGAAFAKGDPLTVNNVGKFIKQTAAGGVFFAVAEAAATAADQLVSATVVAGYSTIAG